MPVTFNPALVERTGDIGQVLGEFLDRQVNEIQRQLSQMQAGLPSDAVMRVLNAFVSLEGTRQPLQREVLRVPGVEGAALDRCLHLLEDARILRFDEGTYELVHDTLAQRIAARRSQADVALLEVLKLIRDRYDSFHATGSYLNSNELQLVEMYEDTLRRYDKLRPEQWAYYESSLRLNRQRKLKRRVLILSVMAILVLATIASFTVLQLTRRQKWQIEQQKASIELEKKKAEKLLQDFLGEKEAREEAEKRLAEMQAQINAELYETYLSGARELRAVGNYAQAIGNYENARKYTRDEANIMQLDKWILECRDLDARSRKAAALIQEGQKALSSNNPVEARQKFNQAQQTAPAQNVQKQVAQTQYSKAEQQILLNAEELMKSAWESLERQDCAPALRRAREAEKMQEGIVTPEFRRKLMELCKSKM